MISRRLVKIAMNSVQQTAIKEEFSTHILPDRSYAGSTAGCCWLRQCSVPKPSTKSTAWIPTTGLSVNKSAQYSQRDAVVWVVEGGDDDGGVADVKIGVAGGQTIAVVKNRRGHGQGHNLDFRAVFQTHALAGVPGFRPAGGN